MKLLFYIYGITGGGGERVLSTLVNEFTKRGEEVHLATQIENEFAYKIDKNVILHNLYKGINKSEFNFINSLILRKNIRFIAKQVRPDIIITFMSSLGCSVIFSTLGLKIPVIVSVHTTVTRFLGHFLNLKCNILYPFADAVTVLTRHDLGIWNNKIWNTVYMPNPINLNNCNLLGSRKKIILAVGRVTHWEIKGFDNLLRCWGNLCHDFPDWKLVIAGYYDDKSSIYLTNLAAEYNCINYEFLGFRNDINNLMQQSEIFCLSSRIEGLPMALIEAMNAGCCCVSFDVVTGPREIITNNKSGLIAKNQDNRDLTEKLRTVLVNEDLRHFLAKNANSSVEKYSTSRILRRWYILFNKILKK